jgi:hypothetical protein
VRTWKITAFRLSDAERSMIATSSAFCCSVVSPGFDGQSMLPTVATHTPRNSRDTGAGGGALTTPLGVGSRSGAVGTGVGVGACGTVRAQAESTVSATVARREAERMRWGEGTTMRGRRPALERPAKIRGRGGVHNRTRGEPRAARRSARRARQLGGRAAPAGDRAVHRAGAPPSSGVASPAK